MRVEIGSHIFLMIPLRTTSFQRYSWCLFLTFHQDPTKKRMGVIRISLLSGRACCLNCSEDQLIQQVLRQAEDWELLQQFSKSIHFLTKESRHHLFAFSSCSKSSNFTSPGSITAEFAGLGVSSAIAWLSKSLSSSPTCGRCDSARYPQP